MQDIYRKKNFFSKKIYTKILFCPYLALADIGGGTEFYIVEHKK